MHDKPVSLSPPPQGYADWLAELKSRIHHAQQRATLAVNRELVLLYWQIGRDILARQAEQVPHLMADLFGWLAALMSIRSLPVCYFITSLNLFIPSPMATAAWGGCGKS